MIWMDPREICLCSVQVAYCVCSLLCWGQAPPAKSIAEAPMRLLPEFPLLVQMLCPPGDALADTDLQRPFLLAFQILLLPRPAPLTLVVLASEP